MQITLSYSQLFEPKQNSLKVDDVLDHCITHRAPLLLTLGASEVTMSLGASEDSRKAGMVLKGHWRSPLQKIENCNTEALLLTPFLFYIEEFLLPCDSFYTFGRNDRSVADLFMRNYFFAACRKERITLQALKHRSSAAASKGSRDLTRTYLWITKALFGEKVFNRSNASELVMACAHFPLLQFSNPLLEAGAADLRRVSARAHRCDTLSEQKRAFLEARKRMIAMYLL